ncbi:homodimeric glycerol 3-phosphate dehydrogenase (quinone) [Desulforhopalus singaporensis]|uniref:Glycerol-3-phosphate dehydrogenase n=2 Tax=Desulforhopalus singaporensis TaxID=91360 RepID=A0A1H0RJ61_9BACT|nr:homodimeric glycerol 3-phosphate dehydrogenase (quinone) [Desulforhopalus singaporensis]
MAGLMTTPVYDIAIIGGGINGCGIARDAAGRGLSVFLCERDDLASGTSSASTKLIHGGLRYLEYYEFRLVREALREREILLTNAPHIVWPLRFILPHHRGLRPAWLIRLGLLLYDHLGGRRLLPGTSSVNLQTDIAGRLLKKEYRRGFEYSDCWVMDSRLVILNAMDARRLGAVIRTRSPLVSAVRSKDFWTLTMVDLVRNREYQVRARALVNASGPWLDQLMEHITHGATREHIRMVQGSHIIVKKLFDHSRAYIFQNSDGRIIFAIPYEHHFTLIGTTEVDFSKSPETAAISDKEIGYLCGAISEYFARPITANDVVSSFSGVRPLFDDGKSDAKAATRDYVLKLDTLRDKVPLLSIYGGKITTYRKLAESVLARLAPYLPPMKREWTTHSPLPGGDFRPGEFTRKTEELQHLCPLLDQQHAHRLFRAYGTLSREMIDAVRGTDSLGVHFGHNLYSFEVDYLIEREWAMTADDILWRRTRLGLFLNQRQVADLESYIRTRQADGQPGTQKNFIFFDKGEGQ